MLKSLFTSFTILLFILPTIAQIDGVKQEDVMLEDNIFLDGVTTDYYSGDVVTGVNIKAVAAGKTDLANPEDEIIDNIEKKLREFHAS